MGDPIKIIVEYAYDAGMLVNTEYGRGDGYMEYWGEGYKAACIDIINFCQKCFGTTTTDPLKNLIDEKEEQ